MRIAFSTSGNNLNSDLDSRFGRTPKFLVYNLENDTYEVIDNEKNLNAAQGAGIQSAETLVKQGVQALVTGHCGPNAYRVLLAAGIKIYYTGAVKISEALEKIRMGKLQEAKNADVEGHWT
jgi:predicted Fe-Mo cluster-binding NifX family protein